MRKVSEVTIGAHRYRIRQLGAVTGGEMVFRLGLPLVALAGAAKLTGDVVGALARAVKPEDFAWAVDLFVGCTELFVVDQHAKPHGKTGEKPVHWQPMALHYDEHFAGEYGNWLSWLKEVATLNFGAFFAESAAKASGTEETGSSASSSPTTAGGSTTDSSSTPE